MGEQSGMGVGEHRANGRAVGQRGQPAGLWKRPDRGDDARQSRGWDIEDREKLLVPRRLNHIKELRARGVAGLNDGLTPEARQQKRVDGADADFARFRPRLAVRQASSSQRAFAAENMGSSGRPLLRRMVSP